MASAETLATSTQHRMSTSCVLMLLVTLTTSLPQVKIVPLFNIARKAPWRTTREPPLERQARPYTVERLFKRVFRAYVSFTKLNRSGNTVSLTDLDTTFMPKVAPENPRLEKKLRFVNGTFADLSRVERIAKVTVYNVDNRTAALSDALVAGAIMDISYRHGEEDWPEVLSEFGVQCLIDSPIICVVIRYSFVPPDYTVRLVSVYFHSLGNVTCLFPISIRDGPFDNELGDILYRHFLRHDVEKVEAALFQQFDIALRIANISYFMKDTLIP